MWRQRGEASLEQAGSLREAPPKHRSVHRPSMSSGGGGESREQRPQPVPKDVTAGLDRGGGQC